VISSRRVEDDAAIADVTALALNPKKSVTSDRNSYVVCRAPAERQCTSKPRSTSALMRAASAASPRWSVFTADTVRLESDEQVFPTGRG
jgi:hypothetical protein